MAYSSPYDQKDLQRVGMYARKVLKEENLRHVVYAYIEKANPTITNILDWGMVKFKSDAEFTEYLDRVEQEAEMIYAVHAL